MKNNEELLGVCEIDIDVETFSKVFIYIKALENDCAQLAHIFNSVNIVNDEISNHLLSKDKNYINVLQNEVIFDLKNRISSIRTILLECDPTANYFFSMCDLESDIGVNRNDSVLVEYLSLRFGDNFSFVNGGYCIKTDDGDLFYLSSDCISKEVELITYYPGQGQSDSVMGDSSVDNFISSLVVDGEVVIPSGTVIAVSNQCKEYGINSYNLYVKFDALAKDCNINVKSIHTIGFSTGGHTAVASLAAYMNNPDFAIKDFDVKITCIDGGDLLYNTCCTRGGVYYDSCFSAFYGKNISINIVSSGGKYNEYNSKAASLFSKLYNSEKSKIDVNYFYDRGATHRTANDNFFSKGGLYNYLSGNSIYCQNANLYDVSKYSNGVQLNQKNYFETGHNNTFINGWFKQRLI